ncbi:MAG: hypothetical protein JW709_04085, partial [Sedimentisphaerales bacterium]|nr:hypothetical protein [Sedimentisphaerales bacterium]
MNTTAIRYLSALTIFLLAVPLGAVTEQGTDTDGDVYQVQLLGSGNVVSSSLSNMQVSGTNAATILSITVQQIVGDGQVNVSSLTTGGSNLGTLRIAGDLGNLACGS